MRNILFKANPQLSTFNYGQQISPLLRIHLCNPIMTQESLNSVKLTVLTMHVSLETFIISLRKNIKFRSFIIVEIYGVWALVSVYNNTAELISYPVVTKYAAFAHLSFIPILTSGTPVFFP